MNRTTGKGLQILSLLALLALTGCSTATKAEMKKEEQSNQTTTDQEKELDDDIELSGLKDTEGTELNLADYSQGARITKGGTYTLSGSTTGPVAVEAGSEEVTLNLKAATIRTEGLPAIFVRSAGSVTVNVSGQNVLETTGFAQYEELNAAFYSKDDLVIKGDGTLKVTSSFGHAIKAKDSLESDKATLILNSAQDGIHINETGTFQGGSLTITSTDEGIQSETDLLFNGVEVNITSSGDGIRAENDLSISSGKLSINSGNEGLESKNTLTISGGTVNIQAVDDGINAASSLTISGGEVTSVSSTNDGIDSNGDLILSGGTIVSSGIKSPEIAFDTDNTPFEISGGTIIGLGSMGQNPTKMDQNVIELNVSSLQNVKITQDGNTLLDWSAPQGMKGQSGVLTLSVSGLQAGKDAVISVNSTEQTVSVSEGLTTVGQIATMGGQGGPGSQGGPDQSGLQAPGNGDTDSSSTPEDFDPSQRPGGSNSSSRPGGDSQKGNRRPGNRPNEDTNSSATSQGEDF